jgi:glucosamine-6-phosphate deaminase
MRSTTSPTINIYRNARDLGQAAAARAAEILESAIARQNRARVIVATGASQFAFLEALTSNRGLAWSKVEMFHLDEYAGLPMTHPASFRKYLMERFIHPTGITNYHFLDGEGDLPTVCREVGAALNAAPIDVAFVGIGENAHLAFNDPPADFETDEPYLVVHLDEQCRRQQVGEGWFRNLSEVPAKAISMSVRQILKSRSILCIVPDLRKAGAVKDSLEGAISPQIPASILRTHPDVTYCLDEQSASLLT